MDIQSKNEIRRKKLRQMFKNPARVIVTSFILIILIGALLLMLPFSTNGEGSAPFPTALMTAVSSTSVTGILLHDTSLYWSRFGQLVILLLIQVGGLGLVTITTFFNLALRRKIDFSTMHLVQESVNIGHAHNMATLVRMIVFFTLCIEMAGAVLLSFAFIPEHGLGEGLYLSMFMSVSAYCNAGIDVFGVHHGAYSGMTAYYDNPLVLAVTGGLIVIGGLGFIVWHDLVSFPKSKRLLLHTKLVLACSVILIFGAALMFLLCEWNNTKTIGSFSVCEKIGNALYYSVNLRTTGFATFPIEGLSDISKLVSTIVMFIGAAPGSTGGGIKVTTVLVLLMTTICVIRGKEDTIVMGRRIARQVVYKALTVTMLSVGACFISICLLSFTAHASPAAVPAMDALFETVSAFSTTGYTLGIVGFANLGSKIMLTLLMFLGRVGPVSIALSLAMHPHDDKRQIPPEGIIMVG